MKETTESLTARKEGARRFPLDMKAANSFHRAALGWTPPDGVRLTQTQRKAVSEGRAFRAATAISSLNEEGKDK